MKKKQIIQKETEFTELIQHCAYKKNSYFVIYYRPNKESNRYGISVPKKTGKAHVRNKMKRRIKNIIDHHEKEVHSSYDYVIIIRKRLIELDYHQMEEQLMNLLKQIGEKYEQK